jgi:AcrR family transcriptional regulator
MKSGRRTYRMTARAEGVQATRARILEAALDALMTQWYDDVRLADVAKAAGVSQQTLLNHFGTKSQLVTAVIQERFGPETEANRFAIEPGDVRGGLEAIVDEYDRVGDAGPRFIAMADRTPELAEAHAHGRASHRRWAEHVFGPRLAGLAADERERRLAVLVSITDNLMWKLLRRDQDLSRDETVTALEQLADALTRPERTSA